jgi:RIO-like serine/threonine protein kinase
MDQNELIKEINKIKVTKPGSEGVIIANPTDLPILSYEKSRAVIGIDQTYCAVYFTGEEKAEKEFQAIQMGTALGITPNVYGRRGTYVIMEPIKATTLADYLEKNTITKELTQKLLQLLTNFKKIGYTRMDHKPEYIYLMSDGSLKVVNIYRHTKLPSKLLPKRIMRGMGKQITLFLQYVKKINPSMYNKWATHPEFNMTIQKINSPTKNRD